MNALQRQALSIGRTSSLFAKHGASSVVWRGLASKSSDKSPHTSQSQDPPKSSAEQPTSDSLSAATEELTQAATIESPVSPPPIPPSANTAPPHDNQAQYAAAATSSLKEASSTPTPSSTLSSFSTPTAPSDTPSSTNLTAQEFKDKSLLEKLQDLWYERSGTSEILALKESVNEASLEFDQASTKVTFARRHLDEALREWERTSGQHLQLLQRRESWTSEDAQSFANLVGNEITTRTALEQARQDLATAEETLSRRQLEYMNRMRRRYHEEQIWQDQWRVLGTYGTWSLIVLNSCVFLGSQYFLQLRENARMKAIEELVRENSAQITAATDGLASTQAAAVDTKAKTTAAKDPIDNERLALVNDGEVELQDELLREEAEELVEVEHLEKGSLKQRLQVRWQKVMKAAAKSWQKVASKSNAAIDKVKSKTHEVVSSIPGWEEMPKSPSEVDVPSAIVGASVTSVAAVVLLALVTPRSK